MFVFYNPNPGRQSVGDCTVRALTKLLDSDWVTVRVTLGAKSLFMYQGDPQQIIQSMLSSGQVTQEQVNQCYNNAVQFQNTFFHK